MIGNYVNERRLHNLSHACVQSRSNAIPSLSRGSLTFRSIPTSFFKSPLKTSTELGLRHGRGKTNRVTLIICTEFRKPEGISNSDARGRRYVRPMRDTQKEKNIQEARVSQMKEICSVVAKHQRFLFTKANF